MEFRSPAPQKGLGKEGSRGLPGYDTVERETGRLAMGPHHCIPQSPQRAQD